MEKHKDEDIKQPDIERVRQYEIKIPSEATDDFARKDVKTLNLSKNLLAKRSARLEIKDEDGRRSASVIDSTGKVIYYTIWEDEINDLESVK